MRKTFVSVFLGTSIDGCIAGENGDLSWLAELAPDSPEATGYAALMAQVDTLLIGRSTYDAVLGFEPWPYAGKRVVVLSHRDFTPRHGEQRREGSIGKVLAALAAEGCRHVYLDGGAVIRAGLREGAIDSLTLSVLPVVLGKGVRLFEDGLPRSDWRLEGTRQLPSGVVQLRYGKRQAMVARSTIKPE
ncbi:MULTISPECIES: dihydrofolate reductase family protein [unclassified Janthinobacterium]|uniref:dihydrofolate reductase family protein n=1 Tax=unclassified Janthinobacterium TaxID=2610881 RepID=UPI00088C99A5|nr:MULTISPECIES: dihydrofolate reductase family protein [unclassified Janthinobacterium]SDA79731.1 Dihydrofolate reductase [Janthinobacterium sp. 551a]SFB63567.1 Dihydrofolate reductase [Janthinobacterium sp. 344]